MDFVILPVESTGTTPGGAGFVCRAGGQGGFVAQMPDTKLYPRSPRGEALRSLRLKIRLNTMEASKKIGITGADLGRLERGEATLESDLEWDRAEAMLDLDFGTEPGDETPWLSQRNGRGDATKEGA